MARVLWSACGSLLETAIIVALGVALILTAEVGSNAVRDRFGLAWQSS